MARVLIRQQAHFHNKGFAQAPALKSIGALFEMLLNGGMVLKDILLNRLTLTEATKAYHIFRKDIVLW